MLEIPLTQRQKKIFEFIRTQINDRGYGPTVREIADRFDIGSPNGVVGHLRALETKGYICRTAKKSRSIELSPEFVEETRGIPMAGVVKAGAMHEAVEQHDRIDFDSLLSRRGAYALKVSGDSMIDASICDGDYVVIHPKRTAKNGQMVVVRSSEGEATLKYWHAEKNRIRLEPANSDMKPIYTKDAKIIGIVVGVVRQLPIK